MAQNEDPQTPSGSPILRFSRRMEKEYLRHYAETRLITSRLLIATGLAVFGSFVILDYIAFPLEAAIRAWLIRGVTMAIVLATLAFTSFRKRRISFTTVFLLAILINTAVVAIDVIGSVAAGYSLTLGSLFVMIASFTLVRFPFWISVLLLACMSATQLAAMLIFMNPGVHGILNNLFFYAFIMAMLLISNNTTDCDSRKLFLLAFYHKKYEKSGLDGSALHSIASRFDEYLRNEKAYLDAELTIDAVAKTLHVKRHHLTQAISEASGTNFLTCVNQYRVNEAKRLLETTNNEMTVLRIAYDTGFNSKATFNRIFRKMTGLSPSDYRHNRSDQVSGPQAKSKPTRSGKP